jgi:GntR family transcriptional repressor for pyruvate dehydrogenase complex
MATTGRFQRQTPQLSQPRVAEMVADILRAKIVDGELADGELLPKQDDLLAEFPVSRPSIREAMRILETEGLISVRRGNIGGAEVHAPKAHSAAYMLGLVMQSRQLTLADLAEALRILEPACAALCASRDDRHKAVVPRLRELNKQAENHLDDGPEFTNLARHFHDQMVGECGNVTMILLVGTLETLWSHHESRWAEDTAAQGRYPELKLRQAVLKAHLRLTDAIDSGNPDVAHRTARKHLDQAQSYVLSTNGTQRVNTTGLRSRLAPGPGRGPDGYLSS